MTWIVPACLSLGLLSALVAGVFQAFSDFVMRGLVRAHPASGMEAMQHINRTVFRSLFLLSFLALAPASIAFAVYAWINLDGAAQRLILAGAGVYVLGVFAITMLGNVPMNERLARLGPASSEGAAYWRVYGSVWTRWNHVRTLSAIAAAGCYLMAAVAMASVRSV